MRNIFLTVFAIIIGTTVSYATAILDGKALLERKCSMCHEPSRALLAKKDAKQWDLTITRMMSKAPGTISEDEKMAIIVYLMNKDSK